jgi:hypothetical protein
MGINMPKASLRETVRNPGFYLPTTALTSSERINYFFILSSYSRFNKSSVLFLGIRERSISFSKVDEKTFLLSKRKTMSWQLPLDEIFVHMFKVESFGV